MTFKITDVAVIAAVSIGSWGASLPGAAAPPPTGKLVDLGGHRLHVNCTGRGGPVVVVETGLGDFSFDWVLVQRRVAAFTRVCTYDRAGYAWSDPGPQPRTFAQLNLELRDALSKLGERGPFVLVGHSYGGPVVRNFALTYARDVAGVVLVDSAFEGMRVGIGGNKTLRLGEDARGRPIPAPREEISDADEPAVPAEPAKPQPLDPMYRALPAGEQKLRAWAQPLPQLEVAEASQREWSSEYFAKWLARSQAGTLGAIPLVVLTRAEGGYRDADVKAAELERERREGQAMLAKLSSDSRQVIVRSGHSMNLEAPEDVAKAIREVVEAARRGGRL